AFPGVTTDGSVYNFNVPVDATFAPTGATTAVPFSIVVVDATGTTKLQNNPAAVIRVDRDAPQITAVAVLTAPDFTGTHSIFSGVGAPLSVTANISDEAGVDA